MDKTFLNKIIQDDALKIIKGFPNESFDAVITDPPFGIGFKYGDKKKDVANSAKEYWEWFKPIYKEMLRVLKKGGFMAVWQTQLYYPNFWNWYGNKIHIYAGCKNFVQLCKTGINYGYDPIIMFYKDGEKLLRPEKPKRNLDFFVANTASMVSNTKSLARKHPCPRPLDQVEQIIDNFVIEKGLILDPFAGSGTIGVAAKNLKRNFILVEKEKDYCELSGNRIFETLPYQELEMWFLDSGNRKEFYKKINDYFDSSKN